MFAQPLQQYLALHSTRQLWQQGIAHCFCASHLIQVSVSQTKGIFKWKGVFPFLCMSQTMSEPAEKGKAGAHRKGGLVLMGV